jgi:hypothetical protein
MQKQDSGLYHQLVVRGIKNTQKAIRFNAALDLGVKVVFIALVDNLT